MATRTAITWEEFLASAVEGQKCEWIDGEVVQMSPVNLPHERVIALLIEYLVDYCRLHREWFGSPPTGPLLWLPETGACRTRHWCARSAFLADE
jgi:Uma2 family endonuclease